MFTSCGNFTSKPMVKKTTKGVCNKFKQLPIIRHAKRQLFYTNLALPKIFYLKKCVNYNKLKLRQNSLKGPKNPNSAKNAKK